MTGSLRRCPEAVRIAADTHGLGRLVTTQPVPDRRTLVLGATTAVAGLAVAAVCYNAFGTGPILRGIQVVLIGSVLLVVTATRPGIGLRPGTRQEWSQVPRGCTLSIGAYVVFLALGGIALLDRTSAYTQAYAHAVAIVLSCSLAIPGLLIIRRSFREPYSIYVFDHGLVALRRRSEGHTITYPWASTRATANPPAAAVRWLKLVDANEIELVLRPTKDVLNRVTKAITDVQGEGAVSQPG
jgi:hypothetical protein